MSRALVQRNRRLVAVGELLAALPAHHVISAAGEKQQAIGGQCLWRAKATGSPELAQHIAALDGVLVAQLDVAIAQARSITPRRVQASLHHEARERLERRYRAETLKEQIDRIDTELRRRQS